MGKFCQQSGVRHADLKGRYCPDCGDLIHADTAIKSESVSSAPSTPSHQSTTRHGTSEAPILVIDDTPKALRKGINVPQSQTQVLSKVQLAPGLREAAHAHARNEVLRAKSQSIAARSFRTSRVQKGFSIPASSDLKTNQFKIDLKLVVVHYRRPLGSQALVFEYFTSQRKSFYVSF